MIEGFLRYSLEHQRRILLIIQDEEGKLLRQNITVRDFTDDMIIYTVGKNPREKKLLRSSVLSASYARGDDGDTMKNE